MAVSYSIPPWIGGAGSALGAVQAGASLGARIAEANQRAALSYAELQAQQQRFAAQMQMEQVRLEAEQRLQDTKFAMAQEREMYDRMRDDQQMEMSKAKLQAEVGLKKQALDLQTQTAAQSFAEQQGYLKDQNALVKAITAKNPDIPQEEAWRQASRIAAFRHPAMGKIAPGFESMVGKAPTAQRPMKVGNQLVQMTPDGPKVVFQGAPSSTIKATIPIPAQDKFGKEGSITGPLDDPRIQAYFNRQGAALPKGTNQPQQSPFYEGALVRSKSDNKMYRIVNGMPVLADQAKTDTAQESPSSPNNKVLPSETLDQDETE